MTFSTFLCARLSQVGAKQVDLARALTAGGIPTTQASISLMCSGHRMPRGDMLRMMLDLLAVINPDERLRAYELAASSSTDNGVQASETA